MQTWNAPDVQYLLKRPKCIPPRSVLSSNDKLSPVQLFMNYFMFSFAEITNTWTNIIRRKHFPIGLTGNVTPQTLSDIIFLFSTADDKGHLK